MTKTIVLEGIRKSFGEKQVLRGITGTVEEKPLPAETAFFPRNQPRLPTLAGANSSQSTTTPRQKVFTTSAIDIFVW